MIVFLIAFLIARGCLLAPFWIQNTSPNSDAPPPKRAPEPDFVFYIAFCQFLAPKMEPKSTKKCAMGYQHGAKSSNKRPNIVPGVAFEFWQEPAQNLPRTCRELTPYKRRPRNSGRPLCLPRCDFNCHQTPSPQNEGRRCSPPRGLQLESAAPLRAGVLGVF